MADDPGVGVRIARPRWGGAVLVCGKCLKRHQDGKAFKRAIKTELKASARGRKVRVIKISCIGLCPRRAIVVASAATLAVGEIMLVKQDTDVAQALPHLLPTLEDLSL